MAFAVGDSVLVKTAEELCELYGCSDKSLFQMAHDRITFVPEMRHQAGTEAEIVTVSRLNTGAVKLSGAMFWWPTSALTPIEPENPDELVEEFLDIILSPAKE